jgi:hypothetical protein
MPRYHIGGRRHTDDGLQLYEPDQLRGVVFLDFSGLTGLLTHTHTHIPFCPDMARLCASQFTFSYKSPGVNANLRIVKRFRRYSRILRQRWLWRSTRSEGEVDHLRQILRLAVNAIGLIVSPFGNATPI